MIVEELKNSGLVLSEPTATVYHSQQFVEQGLKIGGILSPISPPDVFKDGKTWSMISREYGLPEIQFNTKFDTFCCVIFTIAKAICYDTYRRYGIKFTIEEMYNAFWAGVVQGEGTTIESGMESFRTKGWIPDGKYPEYTFTPQTTMAQFFRRPPEYITVEAKGVLTTWKFNWMVIPNNLTAIFEMYKRACVVLTGFAWASYYGTGVYYDYNNRANHCFLGMEKLSNGNNLISDTYPKDFKYVENTAIGVGDLFKELDKSFKYGSAHICWLTPVDKKKIALLTLLKNMFSRIIRKTDGSLWFKKDFEKDGVKYPGVQKIDDWLDFAGSVIDEVGCKTVTDEEFSKLIPHTFFGK